MSTNNKFKKEVISVLLFLMLAFIAFSLVITCASCFGYAYVEHTPFRAVCGVVVLLAGGYAVFKAAGAILNLFRENPNK